MSKQDEWVKSLEEERAGYLRAGRKDRAQAVEAELRKRGWSDPDAPKGRTAPIEHKAKADDSKGKATT